MKEKEASRDDDVYIDEAMFALLRERREEALKHISDYNPFVNGTKSSLYEKVKVRTPPHITAHVRICAPKSSDR
jgi:hypothetical protein